MSFPKGKYVTIDPKNPEALAICDYSGLPCLHKDLVRQMEWRGEGLVWTGLLVNKRFADIPNEQGRSPILPPDPIPVSNPRPQFFQSMTWSNNPLPIWSQNSYYTWASLGNIDSGVLAPTEAQREQTLQSYYWGSI
ncbi:MAG TPA: hypothetical protein VGK47_11855 [Nitrososphaeraceae archaeon]